MKFQPEFDKVAMILSVSAIVILLYFGLADPSLIKEYWVAFAFWFVGFTYAMLFTKKARGLSLTSFLTIGIFAGLIMGMFAGISFVTAKMEIVSSDQTLAFAIGISEELFFGVFLLCMLIRIGFNPVVAILISSGSHTVYHVPKWGANIPQLWFFFACFTVMRSIFVFAYPKIGVILSAHGFWNLLVGE
jgi:hypothetical protein